MPKTKKIKKVPYKTMCKIFDEVWDKHKLLSTELMSDLTKAYKNNGWTDEEFDKRVYEEMVKEKAA